MTENDSTVQSQADDVIDRTSNALTSNQLAVVIETCARIMADALTSYRTELTNTLRDDFAQRDSLIVQVSERLRSIENTLHPTSNASR